MKILITAPENATYSRYFPDFLLNRLREYGEVIRNPYDRSLTSEEMRKLLHDVDILLTHWGTPKVDTQMLEAAPKLRLIAHAAGSVAQIVSDAVYDRQIPVLSANPVMAQYVAESVLGYMLAGTHRMSQTDRKMRSGGWNKLESEQHSLWNSEIGLIGLGSVGASLLELLRPFHCKVFVYDPFLPEEALVPWDFAENCDFETAMSKPIVSIHASKTPATYHMIDKKALSLLPDTALLINSARGSIVDTQALISRLKEGNLYAVLDVFEEEGAGKVDKELLDASECTLLQPHAAASAVSWQMTQAIIEDIGRFLSGEDIQLGVSHRQFSLMTQE